MNTNTEASGLTDDDLLAAADTLPVKWRIGMDTKWMLQAQRAAIAAHEAKRPPPMSKSVMRRLATQEGWRPPSTSAEAVAWLVLDAKGYVMHAASWKQAAHDHINDAISEHGLQEAKDWVVRPVYTHPAPSTTVAAGKTRRPSPEWYRQKIADTPEADEFLPMGALAPPTDPKADLLRRMAKVLAALLNALNYIEEARDRIGYVKGSPIDREVRAGRKLLVTIDQLLKEARQ